MRRPPEGSQRRGLRRSWARGGPASAVLLCMLIGAGPGGADPVCLAGSVLGRDSAPVRWSADAGPGLRPGGSVAPARRLDMPRRVIPEAWNGSPLYAPPIASLAPPARASNANKKAIVPALMSAVIPGAGQWKNGTILRGLGFAAVEVTGWVAYLAFKDGADDKRGQMADVADARWDYQRYHTIAPDPAACAEAGCPSGDWSARSDSLIQLAESSNRSRFLDYITRVDYACGWDTPTSRHVYRGLWDDREDLLRAASFSGRIIFLNHFVSAVDAFLGARKVLIRLNEDTSMTLQLQGVPDHQHPRLMITSRLVPVPL